MKPLVSIRSALEDPQLLGNALAGDSWAVWRVILIAGLGEELTDEERVLFREVTGREKEPMERVDELWAIVGRRGGKTRAAGTLAAYVGCLCDHSDVLAPGERGAIPIMAASTTQAAKAFNHVLGVLQHSPVLSHQIDSSTSDVIRLTTGIDVEVRPANFRTIRGITSVAVIGDEIAFWSVEGAANPDTEILNAVRPSLATTGGLMFNISSPYARKGELWTTFRKYHGPDGADPLILVAKGPSRTFNPSLPQKIIDRAYERDAAVAKAEYGGEFRTDIEALLTREAVEAVMPAAIFERSRVEGVEYFAFVDPSGGSADSMTLAIGHRERNGEESQATLDAVREIRPPFSPEQVVIEFSALMLEYGISKVSGDRYAGEWPREQFRKQGIAYEVSEKVKTDLYRDLVPVINSASCALLDNEKLSAQLIALERRTARGGRDSIDHPPGGHDDVANAVAGVISLLGAKPAWEYDIPALGRLVDRMEWASMGWASW